MLWIFLGPVDIHQFWSTLYIIFILCYSRHLWRYNNFSLSIISLKLNLFSFSIQSLEKLRVVQVQRLSVSHIINLCTRSRQCLDMSRKLWVASPFLSEYPIHLFCLFRVRIFYILFKVGTWTPITFSKILLNNILLKSCLQSLFVDRLLNHEFFEHAVFY